MKKHVIQVAIVAGALAATALPGTAHANAPETPHSGAGFIRNVGLHGCLSAVGDGGASLVRVKACDGSFAQVWVLEELGGDRAGRPAFTVRKNAGECLELIGEDLPANGRLALRDCDPDDPQQVFQASVADPDVPTWRVSNPPHGSWLKAFHEHEAPYVSWTKEWPGTYAEWEYVPVSDVLRVLG